jgi:hypothetical protein
MILTQYPAETPRRDAGAGGWQGGSMTRTLGRALRRAGAAADVGAAVEAALGRDLLYPPA